MNTLTGRGVRWIASGDLSQVVRMIPPPAVGGAASGMPARFFLTHFLLADRSLGTAGAVHRIEETIEGRSGHALRRGPRQVVG